MLLPPPPRGHFAAGHQVRDSPVYLGIKGKVLVQKGDLEEAPARGVPPVPLPDRSAIFVQARAAGRVCAAGFCCWCSSMSKNVLQEASILGVV
jgi:hypothetical protein